MTISKIPFVNNIKIQGNAGFHNSIFRGKNLGDHVSDEQFTQILDGTFYDLFIGDFWKINNVNWRIAGFDIYYNTGDTKLKTHHIVIIPDTRLYSTNWNSTNDTSTGYVNSAIRSNIKALSDDAAGAEDKIITIFGNDHVLSYRAFYPTIYNNGTGSSLAWTDAKVELLNENEVYGSCLWSNTPGAEAGINKSQLPLFQLSPNLINIQAHWWLRSVYSSDSVCLVGNNGYAHTMTTSSSYGVRPFFLLGSIT